MATYLFYLCSYYHTYLFPWNRDLLQALSHSTQRGGFGVTSAQPAPPYGGRLRGAELLAAREAFEAGELLSMDERAVNAALGLPPPLREDQRHCTVCLADGE